MWMYMGMQVCYFVGYLNNFDLKYLWGGGGGWEDCFSFNWYGYVEDV